MPVRAAVGTFVTAAVLFGIAFQVVSSVVFVAVGALALGAGSAVFATGRALRSSLTSGSVPPTLSAFGAVLLVLGLTLGGLGTFRYVTTLPGGPRVALVPTPAVTATPAAVNDTPTPTPVESSTPTPAASPRAGQSPRPASPAALSAKLPYRSDWTNGLGGWAVTPNWQLVDGVLTNDGGPSEEKISAKAPLDLSSVRDYVVEADIELVRYSGGRGSFGFIVRSADDRSGYRIGHCEDAPYSCDSPDRPYEAGIWDEAKGSPLTSAQFRPPAQSWYHYRVQVKATTITFTVPDLGVNLTTTDNAYLEGGQVGLWSKSCQISIKNFTVTAVT
jgi:hypothetical protein